MFPGLVERISPERPVLIAGPTASGKSALALEIAERQGGVIVNADALQVFEDWRILTARPSAEDEARAPHALYGHVARTHAYSVGEWLRDVKQISADTRLIVVGGTGLYFSALTEGLADIPGTPDDIRSAAMERIEREGSQALLAELDEATRARIDQANPMRIQRAWEVLRSTGRGLATWQNETPPPALPLESVETLVLRSDEGWLEARIIRRFDQMLKAGLLEEAAVNRDGWSQDLPSSKAIGSEELMEHLAGRLALDEVRRAVIIRTRQYAKRQRSWFRSRMKAWRWIDVDG